MVQFMVPQLSGTRRTTIRIAISRAVGETTKKYCEQALPTPKVCSGAIVVVKLVTHCVEYAASRLEQKKKSFRIGASHANF